MFTPTVISTERSEWRNLFKDVSTALDMTGVNSYILQKTGDFYEVTSLSYMTVSQLVSEFSLKEFAVQTGDV